MGVVYLARDESLGREVALKVLSEYDLPTDERRSRFLREARAAAAIRHPNVATIYEIGESTEGHPFIAMEYCDGETISRLIQRGVMELGSYLAIAEQMAAGLAAAHRKGVIHRDIKSSNIIVEPGGTVKILDFGLAKLKDPADLEPSKASTAGNFFGTVPYLSPEQARGQSAEPRSDLFSLGIVLFEMASGQMPFVAESPLGVLERIRTDDPEPFVPLDPSLPEPVRIVISRLLQKDPNDRYQTADDLECELTRLRREIDTVSLPATARKSSAFRTTGRGDRHRRILVMSALIGMLLLAAAFISRLPSRHPSSPLQQRIRSLAVLPFENVSRVSGDEFLSIGLADALVTRLQQIPSLQVRPTSAIFEFRGKQVDPKEAAAKLEVEGILEGRYLSSGGSLRVNLQLTDARTGYSVWAGTVDGNRGDLIHLMDQVSSRTAAAFSPGSPAGAAAPAPELTPNKDAYEYYLRAKSLEGSLLPAESEAQIQALEKAIELDPRFAAAYADMGVALSLRQVRGFQSDPGANRQAEWYARQAVRLDPNLAAAHLALARTLIRFPDRFRESVRENLSALRLNQQDPQALYNLVTYFVSTGDLDEAACLGDRYVELNPSSNDARARGYWYVNSVQPDKAMQLSLIALESNETRLAGHDIRASALLAMGDIDGAAAEQLKIISLVPDHYLGKSTGALVAAARGDRAAAEKALRAMENDSEQNHWAALRALLCHARLGDRDKSLEYLRKAVMLGNHSWYFLTRHPWLQPLQSDPEYQEILRKMKSDLDDVRDDVIGMASLICKEGRGP